MDDAPEMATEAKDTEENYAEQNDAEEMDAHENDVQEGKAKQVANMARASRQKMPGSNAIELNSRHPKSKTGKQQTSEGDGGGTLFGCI